MLARSVVLTALGVMAQLAGGSAVFAADYYVAPNGSDNASGASATPFQTVQKGIDSATQPGDTVTVLPGTYAEEVVVRSQGTAERPIVIRAAKEHAAVLDGAQRVRGWQLIDKEQNLWSVEFGKATPYNNNKGRWDLQPRSEQVFVDGKRCTHVKEGTAAADMPEYSFAATLTDPAHYTLKLPQGMSPDTAMTEITVRRRLMDVLQPARHVILDGLCFRRAITTYQQPMVCLRGEAMEMRNCIVEYSSAGWGLDVACDRSRVHDNIIRFNGCLGFAFHGSDDLFDNNLVQGNDLAGYGEWEAGGTKIVGNGHILRHNRFIDNLGGVAIWLDCGPCNNVIEYNYVSGNHGEGIRAEMSYHTYIGYNIVENTQPCTYTEFGKTRTSPGIGISVQNSAETIVCNNFVKDNRGAGIQLFAYDRKTGVMPSFQYEYPDEKHKQWLKRCTDAGILYANGNLFYNNVLVRTDPQANEVGLWYRGVLNGKSPYCYGNQIDHNFYWDSVTHAPKARIETVTEVPDANSQWRTRYGMDQHGLGAFAPEDYAKAMFSAEYPYAPTAAFPGIGKGRAVDAFAGHSDVDYLGTRIAADRVGIGPIQYQGK